MRTSGILVAAAALAVVAGSGGAMAQSGVMGQLNPAFVDPNAQLFIPRQGVINDFVAQNRVYLTCQIRDEKRAVITNTTGAATTDGTQIWLDVDLMPDHQHQTEVITDRGIPAGQYIAPGVPNAFSCTAWYVRPPLLMQ